MRSRSLKLFCVGHGLALTQGRASRGVSATGSTARIFRGERRHSLMAWYTKVLHDWRQTTLESLASRRLTALSNTCYHAGRFHSTDVAAKALDSQVSPPLPPSYNFVSMHPQSAGGPLMKAKCRDALFCRPTSRSMRAWSRRRRCSSPSATPTSSHSMVRTRYPPRSTYWREPVESMEMGIQMITVW
jgi:hypothetical protein